MAALNKWITFWLEWIAQFFAIELPATQDHTTPGPRTLSQFIWWLFNVRGTDMPARIKQGVLAMFLLWLSVHLLTGGREWEGVPMNAFLLSLVKPLLEVLAPILAGALVVLVVKWTQKIGLQVTAEQKDRIKGLVLDAIKWAEEFYEAKRKAGEIVPSSVKLAGAVRQAKKLGVPGDAESIAEQVHTELAGTPWGASDPPAPVVAVAAEVKPC